MFQAQGINHNIMHVRGLATPLTTLYRRLIRKWNKDAPGGWILTLGLALTTLEMIYFWAVKLRLMEKRHQIILCDRYIWDTQADFSARFPRWNQKSPLWLLLKKASVKPDASILYVASTDTIAQRLYQKQEYPLIHEIRFQQNLYGSMTPQFSFVIDANAGKDVVFQQTLSLLQDGGFIPTPSDSLIKKLQAAITPLHPDEESIEIVHLPVGRSVAVNHRISIRSVPRYFAKVCKPSKRCLELMKPLTKTSPHFNQIEEVLPIGIRTSCILLSWKTGESLVFSESEARQAAQTVKELHSIVIPREYLRFHIRLELFRHLLYVTLHGVCIPQKKRFWDS
jgi:thymidylate kinase